jgi:ribosomal protein S18 acetylase RimI-like enzyme
MTAHRLRELRADDADALRQFFDDVPRDDRTFFKVDISDPVRVVERWMADQRSVRRAALNDHGAVLGFATLSPGVERMSHVADLGLVVAPQARGRGLGRALAQAMLLDAVRHGFRKVTVDIATDNQGAIRMFRDMGFQPEALLHDQLRDASGQMHDIVVLAHRVDEQWSAMLTAGLDEVTS